MLGIGEAAHRYEERTGYVNENENENENGPGRGLRLRGVAGTTRVQRACLRV